MVGGRGLLIAAACWALAGTSLYATNWQVAAARSTADIRQIPPLEPPSAASIKALSLGFTRAAADVAWLQTIQYFGGGNPNERYSALTALINTVVKLDPDFEYPYQFGGIILPLQGDYEDALKLLDAGIARFPNNGLLPYYAGAIARIDLNDSRRAAVYFQQAARTPGAPAAATLLAGVSLTDLDDRQIALAWWNGIIETSSDTTIRDRAIVWRDHLETVLALETLIIKINAASGLPINNLQDLVTRGLLPEVPKSPLGWPLVLNTATGRVELLR
jgi:tetratricopeptide (TPR) repeat protein